MKIIGAGHLAVRVAPLGVAASMCGVKSGGICRPAAWAVSVRGRSDLLVDGAPVAAAHSGNKALRFAIVAASFLSSDKTDIF
mgnify:CR=1 FL=1